MQNQRNTLLPFFKEGLSEAGVDEAGRGCLAGPVVAAAVILPSDFFHEDLNDSKQVSRKNRDKLRDIILKESLTFGIGQCSPEEIDKINILNATFLAMHRAIEQLHPVPAHLIIDGNRFKPYKNISHTTIVKGDGKYLSIAAASILAKTSRDEIMEKLAKEFPEYGWHKNMGYPTEDHRLALRNHGQSPHHRRSFHLKSDQLTLSFG